MEAKLVVVGGEARVTEVQLKLPMIIGRGRNAGLTLPHPLVSRQHCEIYEKDNKLLVNDLGSLNGTFVGEKRITEPTALMPGELLTVGTVTFRAVYELEGEAEPVVNFVEEEETGTEIITDGRTVRTLDKTVTTGKAPSAKTPAAKTPAPAPASKNGAAGKPHLPQAEPIEDITEVAPVEEEAVEVEEVEMVEEVEDVEVAEVAEAEHDTKDAGDEDDDDLQSFLRGLG